MTCQPESILRCTDYTTQLRRKRFNICQDNVRCCKDCPHIATCRFVCEEAMKKEEGVKQGV